MKGGLPFLWVYPFRLAYEFVLRTLALCFPLCFPTAAFPSIAVSFCICVEMTGEQYYA